MPQYQYDGTDKAGKKVKGVLEATSEGDLRVILRSQGIRPSKIGKVDLLKQDLTKVIVGGGNVPLPQLVAFTRQLQVMMSAGVPIVQALEVLTGQAENETLKTAAIVIADKVSTGSFFWEALSAYPKIFPKIYIAMIRAGESSGAMDQILQRLCMYLEENDRIRRLLKSAMVYPVIVISVGIGVIFLLLTGVVPKLEAMLSGNGQELPALTQFVVRLSHGLSDNILFIAPVFLGGVYLLVNYVRSAEGKAFTDRLFYKAPLFGALMQKGAVARFSRTLQTLLVSGVNLIDALDICRATVDHAVIEDALSRVRAEIESGKTMSSTISRLGVFPKMAVQMIAVGENTGALDKMLEKIAEYYERDVEQAVQSFGKAIEPLILVVLGGMIAFVLVSMYLPVFQSAGSGMGQS